MNRTKGCTFLLIFAFCLFICSRDGFAQADSFDLQGDSAEAVTPSPSDTKTVFSPSSPVVSGEMPKGGNVSPPSFGSEETTQENNNASGSDELITVNFENVDIRDVVRILADKAQLNMVVGPEVSAVVNLQLSNVTWDNALNVILKTYNLAYKRDGDLIRIMTLDQLLQENDKVPLETKILTLNFARASEIKGNFQNMLSSRGKIDVNDRTNSLIITDIPDMIKSIEDIATRLDTRTPQVMIEALLVDVEVDSGESLGVNWNLRNETSGPLVDYPIGVAGRESERQIEQTFTNLSGAGGLIKFGTTLLTDKDLDAVISAWQRQQRSKILAHPQVLTLDNLAAKINLTQEIPYTQSQTSTDGSSALSSVAFKEGGISLSVTPHVTTKDNFIYLSIDVKQSFQSDTFGGQPVVDSRSANTNLLVRNRETAVIGGLRQINNSVEVQKFPILGDIPMLGAAFRSRSSTTADTDLMIFITPAIVEDVVMSEKEEGRLALAGDEEAKERKYWIQKYDSKAKGEKITKSPMKSSSEKPSNLSYFYLRPPVLSEDTQ